MNTRLTCCRCHTWWLTLDMACVFRCYCLHRGVNRTRQVEQLDLDCWIEVSGEYHVLLIGLAYIPQVREAAFPSFRYELKYSLIAYETPESLNR